jgi:hypothetical protein
VAEKSPELTPQDKEWLRSESRVWNDFREKHTERRGVFVFFLAIIGFFLMNLFACPVRFT